ncbi:MAG: UDP-glucose/GDP-mannose dehydrogenase family protein [Elusimicrobia bacterium]|nr:UDP-glucose/GDP-mannose dehydrogenase family protein [Elusimicrobiota bacterium]
MVKCDPDLCQVCVIGSGYVGLVTGTCLAEIGHRVVCVDSDPRKIAALKAGRLPIYEPGLAELFSRNLKEGRLRFVSSVKAGMREGKRQAEIIFIAVGTPPRHDGSADLSSVEAVAEEIAKNLKEYAVIVDKSTVPVETGEWVSRTISRHKKNGFSYDVASNPEFLSEGSAVNDFLHPDRIVLGISSPRAEEALRKLYKPISAPVIATDVKSAELIKHASNSFLATKISYINAVATLCEKVGADVTQVAHGMGLDRRIGPLFLKAGIGFGGFCFPKDLEAFYWISKQKGYDFSLLKVVKDINEHQKTWIPRKIEETLWNLEGKTVGLLGLSFKPHTDDMRFAPSLDIVRMLLERRVRVRATDPVAMPGAKKLAALKGVEFCRDAYACAQGADALALVTDWPQFRELDWKRLKKIMRVPLLLDGRNFYSGEDLRKAGFTYRGVGKP